MWCCRRISVALAMTVIAAISFAQEPSAPKPAPDTKSQAPPKPKPVPPEEKWLYPAQRLSADLEEQSWRLKRELKSVALATLGSYWWKQDRAAAERWVIPAVESMTIVPQEESEADRTNRLDALRRLLAVVGPLEPMLRDRLRDVVSSGTSAEEDFFSRGSRTRTANALLDSAYDAEPEQVARAITESLQFGVTESTIKAIAALHSKSPEEAQRLFDTALSQAMQSRSNVNVFEMDVRAFELLLQSAPGGLPDAWRSSADSALIAALNNTNYAQSTRCALANELYQSISAPPADLVRAVALALTLCGGETSAATDDANLVERERPETSDEYLAVASSAKTVSVRYKLKVTAAEKARKEDLESENGGPVRALRIFDNMTPEERAVKPGEYKRLRGEEAVRAALFTIDLSGCAPGLRVVDNSPRETILHIAIGVAEKITGPCYREVEDIAFRQMRRIPADDPNDYIRLLNVVVRKNPFPDYPLQNFLREMDRWKEKDPKTLAPGEPAYEAPWNRLRPMPLAAELFNIPAERLSAMTRFLRNDLLRVDFQLHLVRGFLQHYAQEKVKAEVAAE